MSLTYKQAGVDRATGEGAKKRIAALARQTHNANVLREIGLFGGFYEFKHSAYREPVLVSSVDGVGTKIKLACKLGKHHGLGEDIVNHCLNDLMVCGADPLFFLDYLAFGKLEPAVVEEIISGMAEACKEAGCALIGGETAEMPDIYHAGEFDIAGTIIGVVEKSRIIDGSAIQAGDVMIGIASNGLHTNGYSLARRILDTNTGLRLDAHYDGLDGTLGEALLRPHRSYQKILLAIRDHDGLHGIAHITGGGIAGNVSRLLRSPLQMRVDWQAWQWPPVFQLLQKQGNVAVDEMREVFNLGIGMVFIVAEKAAADFSQRLAALDEMSWRIGEIV
jgi:phosphoribosylformylglycinamidine cyclo-ligase